MQQKKRETILTRSSISIQKRVRLGFEFEPKTQICIRSFFMLFKLNKWSNFPKGDPFTDTIPKTTETLIGLLSSKFRGFYAFF